MHLGHQNHGMQPERDSNTVDLQLPVYVPSEAEAADPVLYAENVRAYMVRAQSSVHMGEQPLPGNAVSMSLTLRAHVGGSCGMRPGWKPATPPWPTSAPTTSSCWARRRPRRATRKPSRDRRSPCGTCSWQPLHRICLAKKPAAVMSWWV